MPGDNSVVALEAGVGCHWHLLVEARDVLYILGCTGQVSPYPSQHRCHVAQNVSGAEVEETCPVCMCVCI